MSSSFRKPYAMKTRGPITYDDASGKPVAGTSTAATLMASIQSAKLTDYDEAKATALGVDMARSIRIYTDTRLNAYDRSTQNPGDIVTFFGTDYIVFAESIWQSMGSSIDHFRYLATRDELPALS